MNPPCYDRINHIDCPKRHAGCAATCPEWAEYVKVRDRVYEDRHKTADCTDAIYKVKAKRREAAVREQIRLRKFNQ